MPKIYPVYLFTGDDEYLKREAVEKLKKALLIRKEGEAFNFASFTAGDCDMRQVIDGLKDMPFLAERRLIFIRHIESASRPEQETVLEYAKKPSARACLVIEAKNAGSGLLADISAYARTILFALPKARHAVGWVQGQARLRGKFITREAAALLCELRRDDIGSLRHELDKLSAYAGKRPFISKEDVCLLCGSSVSGAVFDFIEAMRRKDGGAALSIASRMLKERKEIPEILGLIGWQLRRLKKTQQPHSPAASTIDRDIDYVLDADYAIKKGHLTPRNALDLLIVRICSEEKAAALL